jgi:predicted dehydrogenase
MEQRKARVSVIGVGLIGDVHAKTWQRYDRSELVCVCDINEDRAKAVAEKYGCEYTTDYEEIAKSAVDAVSIATPDFAHTEPALAMIEAGKHVLIEKPLSTSAAEGRKIVAAAKQHGVKAMVAQGMHFSPQMIAMNDTIQRGELGDLVMGYIRQSNTLEVPTKMLSWAGRSGPHWFLFAHSMELARWFTGQNALEVYAQGTKKGLCEIGIDAYSGIQAMVKFERCFFTFETCWVIPDSYPSVVEFDMAIYGTKGRLSFGQNRSGIELSTEKHRFGEGADEIDGKLTISNYGYLMHFIDCVIDGRTPVTTAEYGLEVVAMIEGAVRSIEEGRPIPINSLG